ncbi:MAG: PilZ domain-containing protein, partial [Candidatus Omnitrophota bacterium]
FVPVEGKEKSSFSGILTVDISNGGIGFIFYEPIPVGKKIAVEVEVSPDQEPVLMQAEVKWVKKIGDNGQYRIGMQFVKVLFSGSRSRLARYLGD